MPEPMLIKLQDDMSMHFGENSDYYILTEEYHNDLELIYIVEGKVQITIESKIYLAGSGTVIFINNMESHNITVLEYPYRRYVLMFKQAYLRQVTNEPALTSIFEYRPRNFNHLIELAPENASLVDKMFMKILEEYQGRQQFWDKFVKFLIGQLLIFLFRVSEPSFPLTSVNSSINKKVITDVQNYIDDHFTEEFTIKDISSQFHINMYYLCHLFKDITGSTFKNYIIGRRISFAKDLLAYTRKDIESVAAEAGFNSSDNFIRGFKKMVSITPHQYRKRFLESAKKKASLRD